MIKKNIPNAITCGNLLCGCLGIVQVFSGNLVYAACFVGIALVLDFFDGFTARLLKVSSPIGKDLDSLADMVTFGVVPSVVMFRLISEAVNTLYISDIYVGGRHEDAGFLPYLAFVIAVFSALRLAKFNNDTRQSDSFIGVPTPANAMVICSIPLIQHFHGDSAIPGLIFNAYVLCGLSLLMSFLLVAELPLFALKFKSFGWAGNQVKYLFLSVSLILLVSLKFVAVPLVIIFYILLSIVNNIFSKNKV